MLIVVVSVGAVPPRAPAPADPRQALAAARQALKKGRPDPARARGLLAGVSGWADPAQRAEGLQVLADVDMADKRPEAAALRLREAAAILDEAGAPARARTKLVRRLEALARNARKPAVDAAWAELKQADAALEAAARWPLLPAAGSAPAPDALEAAARVYQRDGSRLRWVRIQLALAVAAALEGRKGALEHAAAAWAKIPADDVPAVRRLRVDALRTSARARLLLAARDRRAADPLARAVADANQADVQEATLERRVAPYLRSPATVQLCEALEATEGAGVCRRMEGTLGLAPTFQDFSREPPAAALSDGAANRTQREYGFLLDGCAREHAQADPMVGGVQFELTWVVQPTGLTDEFQLDPRRFREHLVAECFRRALATFRYPPYRSAERRVVAVPIRVNAR